MKRLILSLATLLILGLSTLAGANEAQDLKSLSTKLWKSPKAAVSLKSQKDDLAIVYGGEDISRSLSSEPYTV